MIYRVRVGVVRRRRAQFVQTRQHFADAGVQRASVAHRQVLEGPFVLLTILQPAQTPTVWSFLYATNM